MVTCLTANTPNPAATKSNTVADRPDRRPEATTDHRHDGARPAHHARRVRLQLEDDVPKAVRDVEAAIDGGSKAVHVATTTHMSLDEASRAAAGIGAGAVRISIGLEDPEDLVADLEQALAAS